MLVSNFKSHHSLELLREIIILSLTDPCNIKCHIFKIAEARKTGRGMVFAQKSRPIHDKIDEENGIPPSKKRKNPDATVDS